MICVVVPVTIIINTVAVIIIWQKKKRNGNCKFDKPYEHKIKINLLLLKNETDVHKYMASKNFKELVWSNKRKSFINR